MQIEYRWKVLGILCLASGLNYADRAVVSSLFPLLRKDLNMSDLAMASAGSFFLWSYAAGSPFGGQLADRISRSRIVVFSLAAWSLITLLTAFATTVPQFLATRVLLGIAECAHLPAALALIADYHDSESRATAISMHSVGLATGLVAGGTLAGYLGDLFGWRVPFLVFGAAGLVLAIAAKALLRDAPAVSEPPRSLWSGFTGLVRVPISGIVILQAMLVAIGTFIFLTWLPLYFKETFDMSLGSAGFSGTFLLQVGAMVGVSIGGRVSDRVSRLMRERRMLLQSVAYLASAPVLLLFLTHPAYGAIAAGIFLFGLLRAFGSSNEVPALCDALPARARSSTLGLMNSANCFAGGIGALLAGLLKKYYGLSGAFGGISVIMVLGAVVSWFGYRHLRERRTRIESLPPA